MKDVCRFCGRVAEGFASINDERYCHEGPSPTCYEIASRYVTPAEVSWHWEKPVSRRTVVSGKTVGRITAVNRPPGVMTTDDGKFRCIRFRIKPSDGSRARWTHSFADTDAPLSDSALSDTLSPDESDTLVPDCDVP